MAGPSLWTTKKMSMIRAMASLIELAENQPWKIFNHKGKMKSYVISYIPTSMDSEENIYGKSNDCPM